MCLDCEPLRSKFKRSFDGGLKKDIDDEYASISQILDKDVDSVVDFLCQKAFF